MESRLLDCELSGRRKAARLLGHHGKRRHSKGSQKRRSKVHITHDISKRPKEASLRSRIGEWEGDSVAGRRAYALSLRWSACLSGYLVGGKALESEATQKSLFGKSVHMVTFDRGKEFSDAKGLQEALGATVYFCHPYHSWERDQ